MEDVLKILLILGFIIFGVVKKARKEAKDNAPWDESDMPAPQPENPLPEAWGSGEIQENPLPEAWGSGEIQVETVPETPRPEARPKATDAFPPRRRKASVQEGARTTRPASPILNESPAPPPSPDVDIHSLEEVRRGIIWSEILKRKY